MELIEATGLAIQFAWDEGGCDSLPGIVFTDKELDHLARAAIAAVFGWLANPNEEALAIAEPRPPHWPTEGDDRMDMAVMIDRAVALSKFRAVLAALRKQALGEG